MRALVLSGTGFEHLRVEHVPTPQPGPRQLLARVDCAGICTSLIKLVEQGPEHELLSGWDPARWPLILGDEGSVTIVEAGTELRDAYALGSRWVIQPAVEHAPVNHRERYRDGAKDVRKVAVGYTLGGHLAEYVLVTEEILEAGCLLPVHRRRTPVRARRDGGADLLRHRRPGASRPPRAGRSALAAQRAHGAASRRRDRRRRRRGDGPHPRRSRALVLAARGRRHRPALRAARPGAHAVRSARGTARRRARRRRSRSRAWTRPSAARAEGGARTT